MVAKITRRELGLAVSAGAALLGQEPQAKPTPPASPEQELAAAREAIRQTALTLVRFNVPMSVEPACHFKA